MKMTWAVAVCLLSCMSPASAQVATLGSWSAFDALVDTVVANRPDAFYPPGDHAFTHEVGHCAFDPAGFPGLTNTPPHRTVGDVPVWRLLTVETNGWFATESGGTAVHSNAVAAYDAGAWARAKYGAPLPRTAADPERLAEWYRLRRRDRVAMSAVLVASDRWDGYRAALAAAMAGSPPAGAPAPVPPADTNRVAFARVAPSPDGALGFDVYAPGDIPVDVFCATNPAPGAAWTYAGRLAASSPFTPSSLPASGPRLFLNLARGDLDTDGDGIPDGVETLRFGTDPLLADTSGDGLSDWLKIYRFALDPLLRDTDGDGYADDEELLAGTDPALAEPGPSAASVRYYRDADDRVTAAYAGTGGGAAAAAPTPAGNPSSLQERSAP